METEQLTAVARWAKALSSLASGQGLALPPLSEEATLGDLVAWGQALSAAAGGFMSLPALATDADEDALLAWARAVDTPIRGFGVSLPPLPS